MSNSHLRILSLALAGLSVLALGGSAPALAGPLAAVDIVFDGYCDGAHINRPSIGLGTPTTVDGYLTGCSSDGFIGTVGTAGTDKIVLSLNYGLTGGELFQVIIRGDNTWTIHVLNPDNTIGFRNEGTWSFEEPGDLGAPAAGAR